MLPVLGWIFRSDVSFAKLESFRELLGHGSWEIAANGGAMLLIVGLIYFWVIKPIFVELAGMMNTWRLRDRPTVYLEITPPSHSEKTPYATQQLFTVIRELLGKKDAITLYVASSRREGERYMLCVVEEKMSTLQRHLASYLPEVQFKVLDETHAPGVITEDQYWRVYEVKQSNYYAQPLRPHDDLTESDPIAAIAGAMTKLSPGDNVVMQVVLAPHYAARDFRMRNRIFRKGRAPIGGGFKHFLKTNFWVWIISIIVGVAEHSVLSGVSIAAVLVVVSLFIPVAEKELTQAEQEMYEAVRLKLSEPLFRADIRILVASKSDDQLHHLATGVLGSLALFDNPDLQHLRVERYHPDRLGQKLSIFKLRHALPSFFPAASNVLAASELASIYHFPYGTITTEGMVRTHSRTLPAPTLIKNRADDGELNVVLGANNHHGETTEVGLSADERERHMYVIGGTGNGKTTLLQYAIVQDIQNGKGVAVVDPHGDMAAKLLKYIPEERIKDVIYFNPADISNPIGLNLLELPEGLTGDELLLAKDFVTESIVSVFRKIFSEDDSGGHRIEHVLRNAVHTAFAVEGATLFTIRKLLNNPDFRKQVVAKLEDEDIKDFWINEFGLAGNYQKYKAMDGVTTKIGRFQRSVVTRRILEQEKSTIDFDEILNGKILICNLAKGSIGEDTSAVLGTAILTRLQLAAYRRINVKEEDRRPFYLYVDEFQNFVSPLFIQILSESRKYKLFLTMAEQSTSQQDRELTENILDNAGTIVCFRTGNPADEELMLHQFKGYVEEGEITHLPKYNFYMRIAAGDAQEAFSAKTIVLETSGNEDVAERAIESSRKQYAKKYIPPTPKSQPKQEDSQQISKDVREPAKTPPPKADKLKAYRKRARHSGAMPKP